MKLTTAIRTAVAQEIVDAMAAGTANPTPVMEIYTGAEPAQMGQTISDTLLGTLDLSAGAADNLNGVIDFHTISDEPSAPASGNAGWCRVLNRDGNEAVYFSISEDGSADIQFNTTSIIQGAPISISSLQVVVGGA
ncbi:hypothetical protein [Marinobacter shengliensis]|uniref:Phage tail protein n=1 Tax=Marinobacter shengliensis TaxID=1389223 RepID=A0ABV4WCR3_9GAMM